MPYGPRKRRAIRGVRLGVLAIFLVGSAAGGSSIYHLFQPLHLRNGAPAWGQLHLGMNAADIEGLLHSKLEVTPVVQDYVGLRMHRARIQYDSRDLTLEFVERSKGLVLSWIRVLRSPGDSRISWTRGILLKQAKKRLPGLRYVPSRHAPEEKEQDSDIPVYHVPTAPEVWVVLEPGYSITIAYGNMFD